MGLLGAAVEGRRGPRMEHGCIPSRCHASWEPSVSPEAARCLPVGLASACLAQSRLWMSV